MKLILHAEVTFNAEFIKSLKTALAQETNIESMMLDHTAKNITLYFIDAIEGPKSYVNFMGRCMFDYGRTFKYSVINEDNDDVSLRYTFYIKSVLTSRSEMYHRLHKEFNLRRITFIGDEISLIVKGYVPIEKLIEVLSDSFVLESVYCQQTLMEPLYKRFIEGDN